MIEELLYILNTRRDELMKLYELCVKQLSRNDSSTSQIFHLRNKKNEYKARLKEINYLIEIIMDSIYETQD